MDRITKIWKWIKKELGTLGLLIIAVVLSVLLFPIGIIQSLILKPIYHCVKGDFTKANKGFWKYIGNFFYQIWNVVKSVFYFAGFIIDLLGNVFSGELIEDIITPMEDTMLGNGVNTVSVAIGDIERKAKKNPSKINERGLWLIKQLNRFESNHSNKAIRLWDYKQKLKAEK
jgi:hypothetical protein